MSTTPPSNRSAGSSMRRKSVWDVLDKHGTTICVVLACAFFFLVFVVYVLIQDKNVEMRPDGSLRIHSDTGNTSGPLFPPVSLTQP